MSDKSQHGKPALYLARVYTPLESGGWLDSRDGAVVVDSSGRIRTIGDKERVTGAFPHASVCDYGPLLITPGLVDCHQHLCHYEWVRLVRDLVEWLASIYEIETRFKDPGYADHVSQQFFADLAKNGTTTCCVHGPYFRDATDVAFQAAADSGLRVAMGMNAGDRDLPVPLKGDSETSVRDSCELHERWNGAEGGLISHCFTVRPAYCASEELLSSMASAAAERGAPIQCHLAEDRDGQRKILTSFRNCSSETEAYNGVGLLGHRTIMAHGVYLCERDYALLSRTNTAIAHCPRANLLAGGAQMNLPKLKEQGVRVGLGTDLGGGKGLSMFRTMEDAMKVTPSLSVHEVFRMATLDGAKALGLGNDVGSLEVGKQADFIVLCPKASDKEDSILSQGIEDLLSSLIFHGDDRDVRAVYVRGRRVAGGRAISGTA